MSVYPDKLKAGDEVRVVTPSRSLAMPWINDELKALATKRLTEELGLKVTYGKYIDEIDDFESSTIEHRVEDLHDAFADKNVKMILSVIGGHNSNQLLSHLDYELIKSNPKIIVGYSDTTALTSAINAKTDIVTYSGCAFFSFGEKIGFEYSMDYFKRCLFDDSAIEVTPASEWSDELWAINQANRHYEASEGPWIMSEGLAQGKVLGGNLCTLNLLQGTEYMPSLNESVLLIEASNESTFVDFDRDLQSLIHQLDFRGVNGMVIGRFQKETEMTRARLTQVISSKKELASIPIIANADFGHTNPKFTFPVGGEIEIEVSSDNQKIVFTKH